jgi:FkbM family methyltransferase
MGTVIKAARWIRDIGRPLWSVRVGRYSVWHHLSRLYYSLPFAPQHVHLPWGHILRFPKGFVGRLEYLAGEYEPELTRIVMQRVHQGMTVVDGGANIGYYTLLFSHLVGMSGRVYAFEPDPANYRALLDNISTNGLVNVKPFEYGLGRATGMASFWATGGVCSGFSPESIPTGQEITVQVVAIDDILSDIDQLHFVKLDVEGVELECLEGMRNTIQRSPNISVVLEVNLNKLGVGAGTMFVRLREFGFSEIYAIEDGCQVTDENGLSNLFNSTVAKGKHVFNLLCVRR